MTLHLLYYLSWVVTILIGLITFVIVKHYLQVRSLPPGPFSFPIIGNLLKLRGEGVYFQHVLRDFGKKFNNLYTFWLGSGPSIVVTSWDLSKEALVTKKNDFSGRVLRPSSELFVAEGVGVITSDYGPCWETLRKIMVSAVRKFAVSEKHAVLVTEVVDSSVEIMLKEEKPVEAINYVYLMIYNIIASSAFGKRYEKDDPEFAALRKSNEELFEEFGKGLPSDAIPMLACFYKKRIENIKRLGLKFTGFIGDKYYEHKRTYQEGVVRDFTDALLLAKDEAEKEAKDCKEFLTDGNLTMVLMDYFSAGTDTTKTNLLWILLLICNRPDIQEKMQAEIDENIGSRSPLQEDKRVCHYTQAVIFESLRYRPVIDMTIEHKATCDTELGGYKIPEGTSCLFHILNCQRDESLWEDPEEFKPERFLDADGKMNNKRFEGFMAFGIGRRACAGEKLALANVFLIITRLLQKVTLELENGPGSVDLTPDAKNFISIPRKFYLVVKKRPST